MQLPYKVVCYCLKDMSEPEEDICEREISKTYQRTKIFLFTNKYVTQFKLSNSAVNIYSFIQIYILQNHANIFFVVFIIFSCTGL